MNRPSVANQLLVILSVYAVAYVVLSAANHRRMYELGISTQHIAYTLMPLQPKTLEQAVHETGGRLGEILSHVPLVDDPVIAGHTKDRQITLIVNLRLDWEYWSDRQRADLNLYLYCMELEWRDNKWAFSRAPYPGLSLLPQEST